MLRKIGEDAPVMGLIGIGQGRARDLAAEAHVVELAAHRPQARLNIAQTLSVSELSEGHRQILVPARQTPVVTVTVIAGHALLEVVVGKMGDQLREDGSAGIHPPLFRDIGAGHPDRFCAFLVQIVFGQNPLYLFDIKWLAVICKVLYRTAVWAHLLSRARGAAPCPSVRRMSTRHAS